MSIKKYKQGIGLLIIVVILVLMYYFGRFIPIEASFLEDHLSKFPFLVAGILYIIAYVIVTFFVFFSKDLFWLSGALLFGPVYSTIFICIAEIINAFILFYLARLLGRKYVQKQLSDKYSNLDKKLGCINLSWLFALRIAPLIPYKFLDLAMGLTRISFRRYLIAVVFGTWIKIYWIQSILYSVGKSVFTDPLILTTYFANHKTLMFFSLLYVILIIAVVIKLNSKDKLCQ